MSKWVYIAVETTLACPIISFTAIRLAPPFIKAVAKLCLSMCGCMFFFIPASCAAVLRA